MSIQAKLEVKCSAKKAPPFQGDDKVILATALVCHNWRKNSALIEERQRVKSQSMHCELLLLNEYPKDLVRIFRTNHTPIFQLPILDLGEREEGTGYIDFLQSDDMQHPVMQFRDYWQRPGVALRIRASASFVQRKELSHRLCYLKKDLLQCNLFRVVTGLKLLYKAWNEPREIEIVLALFKRYSEPESKLWSFGWGNSDERIERLYTERHNENGHVGAVWEACPNCPFAGRRVNETVLAGLLSGQDPDFYLPGHRSHENMGAPANKMNLEKTLLIAALAAMVIAYMANYYLTSE